MPPDASTYAFLTVAFAFVVECCDYVGLPCARRPFYALGLAQLVELSHRELSEGAMLWDGVVCLLREARCA